MKLFRFGPSGRERPGILDAQNLRRDASALLPDLSGTYLYPSALAQLRDADLKRLPIIGDEVRLGPCVNNVGNFIAVGLNYADHAAEAGMQAPAEPILFNKAQSCVSGPNDDIVLPRGSSKVDWEVELAIVIGAEASYLAESDVDTVIAGYCVCNDVSERGWQLERGGGQWIKGKGCPTFGPLGPYLVTPDEIADVQALPLWLDLNGEKMQRGSTATMIFTVRQIVAHVSQFMLLRPGDVITTGTPPGVGMAQKPSRYLREGDVVTLGIEGLGEQRQRVVASP
ncbi:fumarylacetoacetate hydrolase family protein [Roseiterribacter gracilis]|uniref:2-hydroxyhepta-2,4-diene-1,7-dioate isomerase n=1 Tax=Roseiterribacter gracilis TaxID=2812848 RepID=A0A8S8X972_9PROT|nr:2-hydroxyhepta-2,4-diene-1,7-dioate isomerase [Rhodospirillales bacterium TMPK1]